MVVFQNVDPNADQNASFILLGAFQTPFPTTSKISVCVWIPQEIYARTPC